MRLRLVETKSSLINIMTLTSLQLDTSLIQQWVAQKLDIRSVEHNLASRGFDKETILAYIREFKKARHKKRHFTGFLCLGLGAFIGFLSCILALLNPIPEWHDFFLFGLTSISILVICWGLFCIFE